MKPEKSIHITPKKKNYGRKTEGYEENLKKSANARTKKRNDERNEFHKMFLGLGGEKTPERV